MVKRISKIILVFLIAYAISFVCTFFYKHELKNKYVWDFGSGLIKKETKQIVNKKDWKNYSELEIVIPVKLNYEIKGGGFTVTTLENVHVTAYNNHKDQTNDSPNIGASNRKVYEGSIALSRDLLKVYNISYGDVACIIENSSCYFIEDTMNKRYDSTKVKGSGNRADIFMYEKKEAMRTNFYSDILVLKQKWG